MLTGSIATIFLNRFISNIIILSEKISVCQTKIVSFALNTKQKRPLLYIYTIININKNSIIKQKPEINSRWQT
jgi:hypothetical protein